MQWREAGGVWAVCLLGDDGDAQGACGGGDPATDSEGLGSDGFTETCVATAGHLRYDKGNLFGALVVSVLLYNAEVWPLMSRDLETLEHVYCIMARAVVK